MMIKKTAEVVVEDLSVLPHHLINAIAIPTELILARSIENKAIKYQINRNRADEESKNHNKI